MAVVEHAYGDVIPAWFEGAGTQFVRARGKVVSGFFMAANPFSVDPRHIHVVDCPQLESSLPTRHQSRDLNRATKPDHSVIFGESCLFPVGWEFHDLPVCMVKVFSRPSIIPGPGVMNPDQLRPLPGRRYTSAVVDGPRFNAVPIRAFLSLDGG